MKIYITITTQFSLIHSNIHQVSHTAPGAQSKKRNRHVNKKNPGQLRIKMLP